MTSPTESSSVSTRAGSAQDLNIVVIAGEGAVNNVKQRTAREVIIEVNDENHRPVGGAIVTLTVPGQGAGGTFEGGKNLLTLVTGSDGRATTTTFEPNDIQGSFNMRITASSEGRTASRTITETNSALSPATISTEPSTASGQAGTASDLNIAVIEGEGAVNNVKQRTAREVIIEVNDENHRPVGGAVVTLTAPGQGAGGTFEGGKNVLTLVTGSDGRATTTAFEPNDIQGSFDMHITASSEGRMASRTITQTNSALSPATSPTESSTASSQAGSASALNIDVISGEGAVNNVKQRTAREVIIEVNDENHRPVGGAVVTLTVPGQGAGGTFEGGKNVLTLVTGSDGRATTAFEPNNIQGSFNMRITASSEGRMASRTITQTNSTLNTTSQPAEPQRRWLTRKKIIFIAAAVGTAVAIAIVVSHQGGYSPPSGYPYPIE